MAATSIFHANGLGLSEYFGDRSCSVVLSEAERLGVEFREL